MDTSILHGEKEGHCGIREGVLHTGGMQTPLGCSAGVNTGHHRQVHPVTPNHWPGYFQGRQRENRVAGEDVQEHRPLHARTRSHLSPGREPGHEFRNTWKTKTFELTLGKNHVRLKTYILRPLNSILPDVRQVRVEAKIWNYFILKKYMNSS